VKRVVCGGPAALVTYRRTVRCRWLVERVVWLRDGVRPCRAVRVWLGQRFLLLRLPWGAQ
jgi:hypothetical protein